MAKYKITPIARFFFFMVIAAPLLFLLATYMTGERKYLDQIIEWVQPKTEEAAADSLQSNGSSSPDTLADGITSDSLRNSTAGTTPDESIKETEETITIQDSLELLKEQLKECRNK